MFSETFILTNRDDDARRAQESILSAVEELQYDPSSCFAIRLALEEAISNAFRHGNKDDPEKTVCLVCDIGADQVVLDVEDQGPGFNPGAVPDPTEEENLEIPCGRGIVLMRSFMTEVSFQPPGNRVRMIFRRPDASAAG